MKNTVLKSKKQKFSYYTNKRPDRSKELFICEPLYTDLINSFWKNVFKLHKDRLLLLQIRFKSNDMWRSLSNIERVSYEDKNTFSKIVLARFILFDSTYSQIPVESLFVRYLVLSKDAPKSILKIEENRVENLYFQPLEQNNLPTDINLKT